MTNPSYIPSSSITVLKDDSNAGVPANAADLLRGGEGPLELTGNSVVITIKLTSNDKDIEIKSVSLPTQDNVERVVTEVKSSTVSSFVGDKVSLC